MREPAMPYRDEKAVLEKQRDELKGELAEATRKAELLADATAEQARVARELAAVEAKLQRAEGRRLAVLEDVRIASPCKADWDEMKGDERVRFCGSCEKNVYNLSAMPRGEAEALLRQRESNICVRLYRRADGTIITGDCPVGVRKKRVRRAVVSLVAGAGALATTTLVAFAQMGKPAATMGEPMPVNAPGTQGEIHPPEGVAAEPQAPTAAPSTEATVVPSAAPAAASPAARRGHVSR